MRPLVNRNVRSRNRGTLIVAAAVLGSACAGTDVVVDPIGSITKTGTTDNQVAPAGTILPTSPEVTVFTVSGERAAGVTVTFTVGEGGGMVTNGTVQTNDRGTVRVGLWRLGSGAGRNTLIATAGDFSTTFTANGVPGPADQISIVAGNEQTVDAGDPVPVLPRIKVSDEFGNGVVGVSVNFVVTGGGGSVTGATNVLTDLQGLAAPTGWQLGATPGQNTLDATAAGVGTVQFFATGQ